MTRKTAFILKGYPRLSETFIAQEIHGLEQMGLDIRIYSLRPPREAERHPINAEIRAQVVYLPEHLENDPVRVRRAFRRVWWWPGFIRARLAYMKDRRRSADPDLKRRFGQAAVLAAELPPNIEWLHAHFLHTPATVTRYASLITGLPWSCSAHARDIWTLRDEEKRVKLAEMKWLVTCTRDGRWHLAKLADDPGKVSLVYHGLDFRRFPPVSRRSHRNGSQPHDPVRLLSVGRAVEKKGFDVLIDALSGLPDGLYWRWTHIGAGADLEKLRAQAEALGVRKRIDWLGSRTQQEVIEYYRNADIFILPAREAADGDRDGLPNVLLEAQSQSLPCIATRFSAIPELILDGETGVLVESGSVAELRHAIHALIRDPLRRDRLGAAGDHHVRKRFSHLSGLTELAQRFGLGPRRNDGRSAA